MNFEEAGACGINKRKFEISMSPEECGQHAAFIEWVKAEGKDAAGLIIPWKDADGDDDRVAEESEDLFAPMFKALDTLCDDIPEDVDFRSLIEEMTDEMAAYYES